MNPSVWAARWRGIGRTFAALRNPNFRLYALGQLVSLTGTGMQQVAQAWLVLTLTGSAVALGAVTTAQFLPVLVFSLFGGVLADRLPKRRLLLATQTAGGVQALIFAILIASGRIELWHVFVLAAALGLTSALDNPARQAFVAELVGRDDLPNAVALNMTLFNCGRVVGPALGGMFLIAFGFAACFYFNAASFLAVIAMLLLMRPERFYPASAPARGSMVSQLRQGLSFAFHTSPVLVTLLAEVALGVFGGLTLTTVELPLVARYLLDVGPTGLGTLTAASSAGSLAASLWLAHSRRTTLRVLLTSSALCAALMLAISFSLWLPATLVLVTAFGFAQLVTMITANTRLQLLSPDNLRGRVISLHLLIAYGGPPLGGFLIGVAAADWGAAPAVALAAFCCAAGVAGASLYRLANRTAFGPALPTREEPSPARA
jgi:MFS family permease